MTINYNSNSSSSSSSLRPLSCELSCLSSSSSCGGGADGSALFSSGSTQIMASVHGPIAPRLPHLHEDATKAQLSVIMKSGGSSSTNNNTTIVTYEKEYEYYITNVLQSAIDLTKYPRCVVQIVLTVITGDGSVLSTALHAAVFALLDASIDLHYLPTCTTCLLILNSGNNTNTGGDDPTTTTTTPTTSMQLDPTSEQEHQMNSGGYVVIAINPSSTLSQNNILASHTSCNLQLSIKDYIKCCNMATKASMAITAFYRIVMEQKVQRESQTLWSSS